MKNERNIKEVSSIAKQQNSIRKDERMAKRFDSKENEWWDGVEEAAKDSIKRGLKQAKEGNVISHDEVMKKYKKWRGRNLNCVKVNNQ